MKIKKKVSSGSHNSNKNSGKIFCRVDNMKKINQDLSKPRGINQRCKGAHAIFNSSLSVKVKRGLERFLNKIFMLILISKTIDLIA
jgi:hypothetical protein